MFLVEEATGRDGKGHAVILLHEDGMVEGRILRREKIQAQCTEMTRDFDSYEVCAVGETLTNVRSIVHEELGL